jgi:hypothetical protein
VTCTPPACTCGVLGVCPGLYCATCAALHLPFAEKPRPRR